MSVDIVTFGCRLNSYESEAIRRHAATAGLDNLVVVNTCAVTNEAVAQARQTIRRIARDNKMARIVVTGCAAQIETQTFAAMPEVARIIGNHDKLRAEAWSAARVGLADVQQQQGKVAVSDIMNARAFAMTPVEGIEDRVRAILQVQNGCDHRCTFCIIPFGRGNSRSVPLADAVTQARRLAENGYREIVLTGVDLTSYGADLPDRPGLGLLVKTILAAVPDLARLRLSSIDVAEIDAHLVDAFANEARLMPFLHLSLQAGDDLILKRMKRRHTRAGAVAFCDTLRRLRPDIVFGADIIAGFPTETEAMFARSLDLVEECGLTHLHVFPYSPRPGTPAARMPQVRGDVVKERARRLREAGKQALQRHLAAEVGRRRMVLCESGGIGRTEQFTPVRIGPAATANSIREIAIAGHDGQHLIAA
jgi:threonylcarbamoyladenosine tRNA methylthiotransferase MtaB